MTNKHASTEKKGYKKRRDMLRGHEYESECNEQQQR